MTVGEAARVRVAESRRGIPGFDGRLRIGFVLFGGMVALQSSPTLDATKIAYLVGVVLCLIGAVASVWHARKTPEVRSAAPWLAVSAALAVLIAMSFLVAQAGGTPIEDWVRDVAGYALFAAVPLFALDAQASTPRKVLVALLVLAGVLGGLSWAVEWLGRRQILELPIGRLVFPSGQLPGMLYLFASAMALTARRRAVAWVVLAGVMLGLFLITGTRSSLLLLAGPLAMASLLGSARIGSSLRLLVAHAGVAVGVVLAFQLALALPVILRPTEQPGSPGPTPTSRPDVLGDRLWSLPAVVGNPGSDPSIKERLAQYDAAWALFASSPVVGVGPGHPITWVNVSGHVRTGFMADTPLVLAAKFGLLGILVFVGAAVAYGSTVRAALRRDRRSGMMLALVAYGVWTIVALPLGFPVEDKGASLALMLLLALAFVERTPGSNPSPSTTLRP